MSIHVLLLEFSLQESFSLHFISQEPSSFFHSVIYHFYIITLQLSLSLSPLKKFPRSEFRILIVVWLLMLLLLLLYSFYAGFLQGNERETPTVHVLNVATCLLLLQDQISWWKRRKYCYTAYWIQKKKIFCWLEKVVMMLADGIDYAHVAKNRKIFIM